MRESVGGPNRECSAALARLRPCLELIFRSYRLSRRRAAEIVEEACKDLVGKWPGNRDPDRYLLRNILARCQERCEEGDDEDPSA
jgi:hypothetical protein